MTNCIVVIGRSFKGPSSSCGYRGTKLTRWTCSWLNCIYRQGKFKAPAMLLIQISPVLSSLPSCLHRYPRRLGRHFAQPRLFLPVLGTGTEGNVATATRLPRHSTIPSIHYPVSNGHTSSQIREKQPLGRGLHSARALAGRG